MYMDDCSLYWFKFFFFLPCVEEGCGVERWGREGWEGMKGGVCLFVRDGRQHPDHQRGDIEGRGQAGRGR